jgi:16S rRNA processing protein RimM
VRLEVGRIVRAHGLRGQVVVEAVSNRPERMAAGAVLWAGDRQLVVAAAGPAGAPGASGGRTRWLVGFEGVAGREAAEALHGAVLVADPLVDPDALWVHELIGSSVRDASGADLGRVVAVEANPASDLLVLEGGALVPLRFVVSHAAGEVVVDPPAGLLDL